MSDIEMIYETLEGKYYVDRYHKRHKTKSCLILTMAKVQKARKAAERIKNKIRGKVVAEIGAGVGYFAIEMAMYAKKVIAVEVDPAWSWYFVEHLYKEKPNNLVWIFGDAKEIVEYINVDLAVICTRSGLEDMRKIARKIAPEIILFWQQEEPHDLKSSE